MALNKNAYTQAWVLQCKSEGQEFTVWAFNDGWAVGWKLGMRAPYKWGRHLQRNVEFVQLNRYWDVFSRIQYCKMGQRHWMNRKQDRMS